MVALTNDDLSSPSGADDHDGAGSWAPSTAYKPQQRSRSDKGLQQAVAKVVRRLVNRVVRALEDEAHIRVVQLQRDKAQIRKVNNTQVTCGSVVVQHHLLFASWICMSSCTATGTLQLAALECKQYQRQHSVSLPADVWCYCSRASFALTCLKPTSLTCRIAGR